MKNIFFTFSIVLLATNSLFAAFPGQNGKIAFERYDPVTGARGISIMNADGSGETAITYDSDHRPVWSPDGSKILFYRGGAGGNLYIMNADGSGLTQITFSGFDADQHFSPNGTQIVFWRSGNIWKMNVDGTDQVQLTFFPPELVPEGPVWSPDGIKIVFDVYPVDIAWDDIYMMNTDGSNLTQITHNSDNPDIQSLDYYPDWSPDGTKLVFGHQEYPKDSTLDSTWGYSIVITSADGSNRVELDASTENHGDPVWSPDGTKIVFDGGNLFFYYTSGNGAISVVDANGTNIRRLTDDTLFRFWPSWQPIPWSYTSAGTNVSVSPLDQNPAPGSGSASVTFSSVTQSGETTVTSSTSGSPPSSGFQAGDPAVYYDISTTASYSGAITLCFTWTEGQFADENTIRLFHYDNNAWADITTTIDTNTNKVCGQSYSFSPFAIFESAYRFTGFFQPVDNEPVYNRAKAGSAVPVKFSLAGYQGMNIFSNGSPSSLQVNCGSASVDDINQTVTASTSSLNYDAPSGQYTYVWKTDKSWAGTCRKLNVTFNDRTSHIAYFTFTK